MSIPFKKSPLVIAMAAVISAADASAQTTLVSEFQANLGSPTLLTQPSADSASAANGNFVVVWDSADDPGGIGNENGIRAQAHFADGTPFRPVFQVNTTTTFQQTAPSVAANSNGDFVVVWEDNQQDGPIGYGGVYGQLYNSLGDTVGNEFAVPTVPDQSDEFDPQVAMADNGDFMVAWSDSGAIEARLFSSTLTTGQVPTPLTADIPVSTTTNSFSPAIGTARGATPQFVIAWQGLDSSSADLDIGIFAQRFNSGGVAQSANFLVNSTTPGTQADPAVGVDTGSFVVAWEGPDGGVSRTVGVGPFGVADADIVARRFDAGGNPTALDFLVNGTTAGNQGHASVALAPGGEFAIAWHSPNPNDNNANDVFYQRFDSGGNALFPGQEVQINTTTAGFQDDPEIAMSDNGEIVAAWRGDDGAGNIEIYALRSGQSAVPSNPVDLILEAEAEGTLALSPLGLLAGALFGLLAWLRRFSVRR